MVQLLFTVFALAAIPDGNYRQTCQEGYRRSEAVVAGDAVYMEENFADPECKIPSLEVRSYGLLSYGDSLPQPFGATGLDFRFVLVTLTPRAESVAQTYRDRNLCGVSNWAIGEELEITGRHCDFYGIGNFVPVPNFDDVRYGVYRLNLDASISFGALSPELNGSTPARRPRYWDANSYFPNSLKGQE